MRPFLAGVAVLVAALGVAACSSGSDRPVAVCGQNGVREIKTQNADIALVVCKNGRVYEVSIG